jgi:hypothetical protein
LFLTTGKHVKTFEIKELIDFDHPLFYLFFGTITGTFSVIAFNLLLNMKPEYIKAFQYIISAFIFAVGIYWFSSRPIAGRYGQNKAILDYVTVTFLILTGIALVAFFKC